MFYRYPAVGVRSISFAAVLALTFALVSACAAAAAPTDLPPGFQDEVALSHLRDPTNFKFAPDGRIFVAQKSGKIVVFENLSDQTPEVFANLSKEVYDNSDHGLLGLALDPAFPLKPYVYALYSYDHVLGETAADGAEGTVPRWGEPPTYEGDPCPDTGSGCQVSGRLVRLTVEGNHAAPTADAPAEKVLLEGWCQQFSSHSIGDIEFGPEGALYVTGGDGANFNAADYGQFGNPCGDPPGPAGTGLKPPDAEGGALRAQSPLSPSGRVVLNGTLDRVDPETGEGWPGNPFAGSSNANARRIIGFGFRNPFRFAINPRTNGVFVNNVGWTTDEEIDRVPIGSSVAYNSGWPCYEGLSPIPEYQNTGLAACTRLYSDPGSTSQPMFYYDHTSPISPDDPCPSTAGSAISGSAFYEGNRYPAAYHDALFFADSVRGCIYVMTADAAGEPNPLTTTVFDQNPPYPGVDLEQGPEGDIFYSNLYEGLGGTIHRISYDPAAPQARLKADKEWGETPLTIHFDAGASTGPAGDQLKFEWDLDGNGSFETGGSTRTETYGTASNVTAVVRVTDVPNGKTSIASLTVYPGDSPPNVTISKPSPSLTWGVGQPLQFAGTAKAEGGAGPSLPDAGLYWKTRLLHCPFSAANCHEHPLQIFPAKSSGELLAPDHDFPSYINFELTATDSRGLSATANVKIAARPSTLQLESEPPGIELTAGPKTAPAPFELKAIENSPTTLVAPATASFGGTSYSFRGWSDGGERVHTVNAGGPATYVATYARPGGGAILGGSGGDAGKSGTAAEAGSQVKPRPPRLLSGPARSTRRRSARFVFEGDAIGYRCRFDARPYAPCGSPRAYRHLAVGSHIFRLIPVDAAGDQVARGLRYSWRVEAPR
jgi:glucose/arabinose dehydrogenase